MEYGFPPSLCCFSSNVVLSLQVSKTALIGLTKALAHELAPRNIRVNCLAPGTIVTKFSELLWNNGEASKAILSQIPMDRFGESHEMGSVAAFLCSDDSSYMTGEVITATGGMISRL